jgi:Tfp pilus assembly protein PilF
MISDIKALISRAEQLAKSGNWAEESAQVNNKIIELDPECAGAYTRLAKIYSNTGDHFAAMNMYEMVLKFEPTNKIANNGFLRTKKIFGNTNINEALDQINSFEQVFSIARKYKYANDLPSTIAAYRRALKVANNPFDAQLARNGLASSYSRSGVNTEAEKIYRENLQLHPNDNVSKVGLAAVLSVKEAYREAVKLCKDVLAQEPHNQYAKNCLGGIYGKQGQSGLADKFFN